MDSTHDQPSFRHSGQDEELLGIIKNVRKQLGELYEQQAVESVVESIAHEFKGARVTSFLQVLIIKKASERLKSLRSNLSHPIATEFAAEPHAVRTDSQRNPTTMRIGFLLKQNWRDHASPITQETFRILARRNAEVVPIIPAQQLIDLDSVSVDCDLYVLKPGVELALSLAGILQDKGARIVNSYPASAFTQDKARVTARLQDFNIPTPKTFITGSVEQTIDFLGQSSVIVKPHRGSGGEGICVVRPDTPLPEECDGPLFVQEFLESDGEVLKVYVIGDEAFAIKRPFPACSYTEKLGQPYTLDSTTKSIALKCGELLDLQIYGVDFIETDDGPVVIDVNYCPGMIGVPRVAERLADYIYDLARDSRDKEPS